MKLHRRTVNVPEVLNGVGYRVLNPQTGAIHFSGDLANLLRVLAGAVTHHVGTPGRATFTLQVEVANPERQCPDGGKCHHECVVDECFRVRCCGPLSDVYEGDEWPPEVVVAFGRDPMRA